MDWLVDLGVDAGGLKTRAETVLELKDFRDDMADDSGAPEDYDGGFGHNFYFARSITEGRLSKVRRVHAAY
ncbi:hypothetical protein [Agromyces sp. NPDC058110]|uniref:hypothetical protein n=1 Tax=Agromyces sp. NPDC058110 TaxID=3346345 RepID=UPI0036DE4BC8